MYVCMYVCIYIYIYIYVGPACSVGAYRKQNLRRRNNDNRCNVL